MSDIKELQNLIIQRKNLKDEYTEAKAAASGKFAKVQEVDNKIIEMLDKNGLHDFHVPGVGKVSVIEKTNYKTPKDIDSKKKFFGQLREKYGDDYFWTYATVNSQSLQSIAREIADSEGVVQGLEMPTESKTLSFRKSNK